MNNSNSKGRWIPAENRDKRKSDVPEFNQPVSPADNLQEEKKQVQLNKLKDDFTERIEIFTAEEPMRRLQDLVVSEVTRQQIIGVLAKVNHHAFLYDNWNLKSIDPHGGRTAINLYGPPGTGKSFCAEAIAAELKVRIIRVNYAEIESKYVGDTPKNIKAAFAKAKQERAILFFDEADSILGKRLTNVTQSADHGVNVSRSVMLMELDRFDGITIFATNLASNYDPAFVRRILGHIEMPLPDKDCRKRLWELHIPKEMNNSLQKQGDYEVLADISDGLSGGDILNAVVSAATIAVQRIGRERQVTLEDLKTAIAQVRKAKDEVGNPANRVTYNMTKMPIEEAPDDVRDQLRKSDGKS